MPIKRLDRTREVYAKPTLEIELIDEAMNLIDYYVDITEDEDGLNQRPNKAMEAYTLLERVKEILNGTRQ